MDDLGKTPYRTLGRQLKDIRTRAKKSLAETSGAVEIDVRELASYELGKSRPNEDVLLLLISHLEANDEEAVRLWEMAGYGSDKSIATRMTTSSTSNLQENSEPRILYSDTVDIMVNNHGMVMNFMQNDSSHNSQAVSRIGMSRDHAKSMLRILQITLSQTDSLKPPRVPSTDNKDS